MLFEVCKRVIENTKASGGDLTDISRKIDVFYAAGKLTDTEYTALTTMLVA
jgi:DNA-binding MltR family transcriptional regulator